MKALITGITGQDGSYLAELLLDKDYQVFGLVRRSATPNTANIDHILNRLTLIEGDLTDFSSIMHALEISQPDEIYNLAAQSHVGTSFTNPALTFQINSVGVSNIIEAIKLINGKIKLYQASTSEMFGNVASHRLNEHTRMYPRSPYGCAKLAAHHMIRCFRESGHFACSGILFNHESPRRGVNFVTRKITKGVADIAQGRTGSISLGNIHAERDWGYARDYVYAMWLMMQHWLPDDYVVGTGATHSIMDVLKVAFKHVGIDDYANHIKVSEHELRPTDIDCLLADASKAKIILGWQPKTSFEDLIKLMVDFDLKGGKCGNSEVQQRVGTPGNVDFLLTSRTHSYSGS